MTKILEESTDYLIKLLIYYELLDQMQQNDVDNNCKDTRVVPKVPNLT